MAFDFEAHLQGQRDWSERTFGPGPRAAGIIDHIRKELKEIEAKPTDLSEWIDVAILALDGAWRSGATPQQIIDALVAKQEKNETRVWPDWRTADPNKAIEHDRSKDAPRVFKVGDRVRIARKVETDSMGRDCEWVPSMDDHVGKAGIIEFMDNSVYPYCVGGDGGLWWYSPEALDLLPVEAT